MAATLTIPIMMQSFPKNLAAWKTSPAGQNDDANRTLPFTRHGIYISPVGLLGNSVNYFQTFRPVVTRDDKTELRNVSIGQMNQKS
jgi:hypothetical protein